MKQTIACFNIATVGIALHNLATVVGLQQAWPEVVVPARALKNCQTVQFDRWSLSVTGL
jgi:hypothetical protein